jgi:hypothetical protein
MLFLEYLLLAGLYLAKVVAMQGDKWQVKIPTFSKVRV